MRALLRVASPSSMFTATPHLLSWAFTQPLLVNIARAWVNDSLVVTGVGQMDTTHVDPNVILSAQFWEWLQCLCASDKATGDVNEPGRQNCWSMATQFIQTTPNSLDILLASYITIGLHVHVLKVCAYVNTCRTQQVRKNYPHLHFP